MNLERILSSRDRWLAEAGCLKPALHTVPQVPLSETRFVSDSAAFQGWRAVAGTPWPEAGSRELAEGDFIDLDFGTHLVGSLEIGLAAATRGIDAPVRLRVLPGEVPLEIAAPREPFHSNMLARTWLQEETVHLDDVPGTVVLPRRFAFRFVRIKIAGLSPNHRVRIDGVTAHAVSAIDRPMLPHMDGWSPQLAAIDAVAQRTLKNCVHTVFEDGPKRDRRLWLGDLRLQALANAATFRRGDIVKRCLLLFAGLCRDDGLVESCIFEKPAPAASGNLMADYALLFVPTLLDYARDYDDTATAADLWPIALHQVDTITGALDADGRLPDGDPFGWAFTDWKPGLHREGAFLGLSIYVIRQAEQLARLVGDTAAERLNARAAQLTQIALKKWRASDGAFVSGPGAQRSAATTAWMILGGVVAGDEARRLLDQALADPACLQPAGPYLWHHVVHAYLLAGDREAALRLIENYWGAMLDLGADTFWEVFDPANHLASPYENPQLNSYCHAWSCTPCWFLRQETFITPGDHTPHHPSFRHAYL